MPARLHRLRIIAIGDELLLGKIADTNSAELARRLLEFGFATTGVRLVGDDEESIVAELVAASAEAELVIVTGGLGPTEDDRTRHALARAMDRPLHESAAAWKQIHAYLVKIGRDGRVAASNRRQALVPRGAQVLRNDRGTAPGLLARLGPAWVACLPGVPHEMLAMTERLGGRLPKLFPDLRLPVVAELHVAGVGESHLQDVLGELAASTHPRVGITAHEDGHITLRLVGSATAVQRHRGRLRKLVIPWLLPEDGLAESLVAVLTRRAQTLTTAESCTCGHILTRIGAVPGASAVLHQGLIAYHNSVKAARLGVSRSELRRHGAVSGPVVRAMAQGALAATRADLAIASSGIAGPGGGSRDKPVGTVWLAVATARGVATQRCALRGTRLRIQRRAASQALLLAWEVVSGRRSFD